MLKADILVGMYEEVISYSEDTELFGRKVAILGLRGLIRSKRAAGRAKDLRALPELEALLALGDPPPDK